MSDSRWSRKIIGGVCYIVHTFDEIGDDLAVHNHIGRAELVHTTLIARGAFEVLGNRLGQVVHLGDLLQWGADEDHGLRALTKGAIAVNIRVALQGESDYPRH